MTKTRKAPVKRPRVRPVAQAVALPIEERVERFRESRRTPAQRRRLRHALNREVGIALKMSGADKADRLNYLNAITYER